MARTVSRGNSAVVHLSSCRHTTSGSVTSSQALNGAMRLRTSLTLKVAMRIAHYAESGAFDAASAMRRVTASQVA